MIMAVMTAKIAEGQEKDRHDFARPIGKRGLDKSFDGIVHFLPSAIRYQLSASF
jgi:hypothetical protein